MIVDEVYCKCAMPEFICWRNSYERQRSDRPVFWKKNNAGVERSLCVFLLATILTAVLNVAFSVLTLSVEHQEEHRND